MKRPMIGSAALLLVLLAGITSCTMRPDALNQPGADFESLFRQCRYERALDVAKEAVEAAEKKAETDQPLVARSLSNLAQVYKAQGKYPQAKVLFERALTLDSQALGSEHLDVAADMNNLAELCLILEEFKLGETLAKRSVTIREKALGAQHADVAASLNTLAEVYRLSGRYALAEPLYARALAIYEKTLGPDHPDVAQTLRNLAYVYKAQGRSTLAEQLFAREQTIREKWRNQENDKPDTESLNTESVTQMWDVEHLTNSFYVMSLDLPHGSEVLSIYVGVDTSKQEVTSVIIHVPDKADAERGLAMFFVQVDEAGTVPREDTIRILPLEHRENRVYQIFLPEHVVPANKDEKELDVLECFLKYQIVAFMYWIDGKEMRASETLFGFQEQYPKVLSRNNQILAAVKMSAGN